MMRALSLVAEMKLTMMMRAKRASRRAPVTNQIRPLMLRASGPRREGRVVVSTVIVRLLFVTGPAGLVPKVRVVQ
jgi:pantothenate kinase-related protein Tda10